MGSLCDYDDSLRGQQRANDDGSFGTLMTKLMMMMTVRRRRQTTPGTVRFVVVAPTTVAIVGSKAAGTLQSHQIPVHLNTLINCTAPKNKKKTRWRKQDGNTMISFFLAFYTLLQLGSSLSSHWYVFLSSQYTVNLFSVKKFAHLVSFFVSSLHTHARFRRRHSLSIFFRGLDCFHKRPSCCCCCCCLDDRV